jgi:hypothetical protein
LQEVLYFVKRQNRGLERGSTDNKQHKEEGPSNSFSKARDWDDEGHED